MGEYGWIEIVLFYAPLMGILIWQYFKMDRELKQAKAERAAKEADGESDAPDA